MNTLIKKFEKQCWDHQTNHLNAAKFAEMIIRECGKTLVDNTPTVDLIEDWDKGYDRAMNDCIHLIYNRFGVKE